MGLLEDLDPEEARGIVDPALTLMMQAVHRYEGYVAQSLGDGIFALFGAPIAHEDHAQQALYAAFEAMKRLFVRESLNQPVLLIMEDLHWLDRETQAWLDLRSEGVATARLLLLVNYRPEYQHAWGSKTYYTQLRLDPLGQAEAEELLTALLGDDTGATGPSLLQSLKRLILTKTEDNPFFMEEIVQVLFEQGVLVRDPADGQGFTPTSLITSLTEMQLPLRAARLSRAGVHL
jgi:predicted ATPase